MSAPTLQPSAGHHPTMHRSTEAHYDAHPFDAITAHDERDPRRIQPRPFLEFCQSCLGKGARIAEIGCGPGRGTMYLTRLGHDVTAVDISAQSLARARRRAPEAAYVRASNLSLPFPDAAFDAVVSDGVIHHTPDAFAALSENARILRPGGHLYLAVYKRDRYYRHLYTYAGPPIRWLERRRLGRALLHMTVIPAYYAAHLVKSRGRRTWTGARSFFYDYIITPRATFHSRGEIEAWGDRLGLRLVRYDPALGNVHAFVFVKGASAFADTSGDSPCR